MFYSSKRQRLQKVFKHPTLTKVADAPSCDINKIMARYERDGIIQHVNRYAGRYEDVSGLVSFQEAQDIVRRGVTAFESLPASIRARFENSPEQFLEFVSNPANKEEMRKMGLLKAEASPPSDSSSPAPTPATPGEGAASAPKAPSSGGAAV